MAIHVTRTFNSNHKQVENIVAARGLPCKSDGMIVFIPSPNQSYEIAFINAMQANPRYGLNYKGGGLDPRMPGLDDVKMGELGVLWKTMAEVPRVLYFEGNPETMQQLSNIIAITENLVREPTTP